MINELKPCFCGGNAKMITEKYNGKEFYGIRCCKCQMLQTMIDDKNKAIMRWNKKVENEVSD